MCSSRKNPYPPHGRPLEIPRGRGVLKVKILEAKGEAKLGFLGGREVAKQKPSLGREGPKQNTFHRGSMDIFWNYTISINTFCSVDLSGKAFLCAFSAKLCIMGN